MKKVPYTNDTGKYVHIGSVTIPPGETRDVDETTLPDYKPESEKKSDSPADPLADLLKKNVADVKAVLPSLSEEDLARIADLEQAGQARKSLVEAIGAETLRRAEQQAGGKQ